MAFIPTDLPPPPFIQVIHGRYNATPFSLTVKMPNESFQKIRDLPLIQTLAKQKKIAPPLPPQRLASIIKIPPADGGNKETPYDQLVCTETDKQNIAYIIQTMAENGKLSLLFKQSELKRVGAEINHVHPLKFLEAIFSNPDLKVCMRDIHHDYFKWNGFMDGLVPSLTNHMNQGKLMQYVNEFAMKTNAVPEEIIPYFQSRDWENLVRYLMNR